MKNNKVLVSVSNDLVSDQRVHKCCVTLSEQGWDVTLVGRILPNSLPLSDRIYKTKRLKLLFKKGALFYAELNIRLFFYLLFQRAKVLHSNDLDTLLANFLVSKIKSNILVYDTHEYFTEVPELVQRPKVKKTWEYIEGKIFPHLKWVFTVNDSIAKLYENKYKVTVKVLRNVPKQKTNSSLSASKILQNLKVDDQKILLLQGAGINIQRGAEELVEAMQFVQNAVLLIVGSGDVIPQLKEQVKTLHLQNSVIFTGKIPFEHLQEITKKATLGFSLDKATNLNYELSLPNKLFDYLHAGVPVVVSNLKEVKQIVEKYEVGVVLPNHEPNTIAQQINNLLAQPDLLAKFKENTKLVKAELNWENEEKILISTYQEFQKN